MTLAMTIKPWKYATPRTSRHPQADGEVRYEMFVVEYSGVSLTSAPCHAPGRSEAAESREALIFF
jgi:hypothetical protein